jgi:hypothetical protein
VTEQSKTPAKPTLVAMNAAKFTEASLSPQGFRRQVYDMVVPAGTTVEDLLDPHRWTHLSRKLRVDDTIIVTTENRSLWAHLWVVGIAGRAIAMRVLAHKTFDAAPIPKIGQTSSGEELPRVQWMGKAKQWCVIGVDGEIVEGMIQFTSEEQARPSLRQYAETLGMIGA